MSDADDALQEAWVRVSRSDPDGIGNMGGFLTTVVANVCLNQLRARRNRRDQPMGVRLPDPIVSPVDRVGLDEKSSWPTPSGSPCWCYSTDSRRRNVRFVLHDLFAVPYDEIAGILGRPPATARQHASRARRRVQASGPLPDTDLASQRRVVDAFLAATRNGDLEALMAVLDREVTLRCDIGGDQPQATSEARGAATVSQNALAHSHPGHLVIPVLVNGTAGLLTTRHGRPVSLMAFTVRGGKITQIDLLADPHRLRQLDLAALAR